MPEPDLLTADEAAKLLWIAPSDGQAWFLTPAGGETVRVYGIDEA